MSQSKSILSNKGWLPLLLVLLIVLNWAASVWHTRIDLTNEKRFTLSSATKKLLKDLKEPVRVDVFLKGNYPSGFKKLAASSQETLQEFKEIAGKNLQYNFISTNYGFETGNITKGDNLNGMGFEPINLTSQVKEGQQQQYVYPYALVHYNDKLVPITLYKGKTPIINYQELNIAEAMLESNFA